MFSVTTHHICSRPSCTVYRVYHDDDCVWYCGIEDTIIHKIKSVHVKKRATGYEISLCLDSKRKRDRRAIPCLYDDRDMAYGIRDALIDVLITVPNAKTKLLSNNSCDLSI